MNYSAWKLFTPMQFKGLTIKNRMMRSAMVVAMSDPDGFITEDNLNWYQKVAEGGVGFIITEAMAVHPRGRIFSAQISAFGEERLPGLKALADTIHAHGDGVVVMPQIHSGGAHDWGYSYGQRDTGLGLDVIAEEDIRDIIDAFAESALLLKRAGFDGVQLHGGHGYLLAQFLSPATNTRSDQWGGSPENRMRFPIEIFKAARKKVGDDFPIGIKMNTADYLEGGNWKEDTAYIAKNFAREGFDFIEMSGGMGFMTELREELRKKVVEKECYFRDAIPLFTEAVSGTDTMLAVCGGIRTPQVMEDILYEGIDMVSLARPWLAEPDLGNRIQNGDLRSAKCVSTYGLCNLCLTKVAMGSSTCVKFFPGDCLQTCPIGQDNPTIFALVAQKRFEEALALVKRDNPLAGTLGRVCHHPCETICRGEDGEPLAIMNLKRFLADYGLKNGLMSEATKLVKEGGRGKVAIIGSGPAGLTCGFYLTQWGYEPTIYEKLSVKGGMLAVGIPAYKLPKDILNADIAYVESAGVEIKTGMALGKDFSINDLFEQGYKAVFIAVGLPLSEKTDIPGSDIDRVISGLDFIRDVNMGKSVEVGKRVVVIGGGNVAVTAARIAVRLGAEDVQLVYRRPRDEMPAYKIEINEAEAEGVVLNFSWWPQCITGDDQVSGVDFVRCNSSTDENDNWCPMIDESISQSFEADSVIVAIGQSADPSSISSDTKIKTSPDGTIDVDPKTLATGLKGVFAGGDVINQPRNAVDAMAAGKIAAESIDSFIKGRTLVGIEKESQFITIQRPTMFADPSERILAENSLRSVPPKLSAEERKNNFNEIVGCLNEADAIREAKRCIKYDLELEEKSKQRKPKMGKATFVIEA
jgi:NADPH-dependent glutamate synthase beta subunit-like oxidoreductase/2,4-dienoyl-CoA reductase-like NADH-dependent reductase (Old Yellow Enzyme family)